MTTAEKQFSHADNGLSAAFTQNNLRRLAISSRDKGKVDTKGPLGLSLLHDPVDPQVDFIFVHGLGGGSRNTWSYSTDPNTFWPKEWLPTEVGFGHVRIHSYGYNSDWTTKKDNPLAVHDFGEALALDMYNSPHLGRDNTPIVFVAHSMGGLVVKKAYLIFTGHGRYSAIAGRIHAMFFLGTPHRGTDLARIAEILSLSSRSRGIRALGNDLLPGSVTLDQINDEFSHACRNVRLTSFVEGIPTNVGPVSSLVVKKESAVLGLRGEHVQYMEADHRHLSKFDSPMNTNYIILRRSFVTILEELHNRAAGTQSCRKYKSHMKKVSSLLGAFHRQDAL